MQAMWIVSLEYVHALRPARGGGKQHKIAPGGALLLSFLILLVAIPQLVFRLSPQLLLVSRMP